MKCSSNNLYWWRCLQQQKAIMEAKEEVPRRKARNSFELGWDLASPIRTKHPYFLFALAVFKK